MLPGISPFLISSVIYPEKMQGPTDVQGKHIAGNSGFTQNIASSSKFSYYADSNTLCRTQCTLRNLPSFI